MTQMSKILKIPQFIISVTVCITLLTAIFASKNIVMARYILKQSDSTASYVCIGNDNEFRNIISAGITICEARPSERSWNQVELENLQTNNAVLITMLDATGISALSGLRSGDLIYRIDGLTVATVFDAAARLTHINKNRYTSINFLRSGRPYLIKLQQD